MPQKCQGLVCWHPKLQPNCILIAKRDVTFAVRCQQRAIAMGMACAAGASVADVGSSALHLPAVFQRTLVGLDLLDAKPGMTGLQPVPHVKLYSSCLDNTHIATSQVSGLPSKEITQQLALS